MVLCPLVWRGSSFWASWWSLGGSVMRLIGRPRILSCTHSTLPFPHPYITIDLRGSQSHFQEHIKQPIIPAWPAWTQSVYDLQVIKWYVDASFAVHPNFKSHTGAVMTCGSGAIQTMSRKQKLNPWSSTKAELVGVDDAMNMILWTWSFLKAQGYNVTDKILYQDNQSTILLEMNGKCSSTQHTRAINIRYFFVTDQVEKGNLWIEYCPTKSMLADYMSKPLQEPLFRKFRDQLLGKTRVSLQVMQRKEGVEWLNNT